MPVPAVKLYERLRRAGCTKPPCRDGRGKWLGPSLLGLPSGGGRLAGPSLPRCKPQGRGGRGSRIPLSPRGEHPRRAGGGRAAALPSLVSRERLLKGQNKRTETKASEGVAGPRPPGGRQRGGSRRPEREF